MAKVMPRLAWMFTNSVCPSGSKVAPANSSLKRLAPVELTSRFNAMFHSVPLEDRPRTKLSLMLSSHRMIVPRLLVVTLSGKSRVSGPGDWKTSFSQPDEMS
jgi:hypothetical protein